MSVPFAILRACADELPRLQAEEALLATQVTALGSGTMKERDQRAALARLQRAAGGGVASRRQTPAATPNVLAAMGIRVVIVPPEESADGR
jgi:hypothetical protein